MKRFFGILATVAIAIVAPSCDDGPTSNYSVLPSGQNAANGGAGVPTVDLIPKQKLGTSTAGNSPLIRCTPEKRRKVWAAELDKPMVPVRGAAGLDGTKNLTYTGLSIDEVESVLCQGDDGGTGLTFFGEQGELQVNWSSSTRLVTEFDMVTGYRGTMDFTDPVTKVAYSISLEGKPIQENGQPMNWHWREPAQLIAQTTKLYNAMMRVYQPGSIPAAGVTDCTQIGGCVVEVLDNVDGVFAIFPLGLLQVYFDLGIDDPIARDIPTRVYVPIQKTFGFSQLPVPRPPPRHGGAGRREDLRPGRRQGLRRRARHHVQGLPRQLRRHEQRRGDERRADREVPLRPAALVGELLRRRRRYRPDVPQRPHPQGEHRRHDPR